MREDFLHFVWQYSQFEFFNLTTTIGEPLTIGKAGIHNQDAGPDFLNARIKIGEVGWSGHVEIHVDSKDWYVHGHDKDKAYDNVVLHVVWEDSKPAKRSDGTLIPTITLKGKVDEELEYRYQQLISGMGIIPCAHHFQDADKIKILNMFDKALVNRLARKAEGIQKSLIANKNNWEETTYQLLGENFGFKLNKEPFLRLTKRLPLKIIQKHRHNLLQIEALLFGQAGLLQQERHKDEYFKHLEKEYTFLSHKYNLPSPLEKTVWKFMRSRPANFPTIRIAQFAKLLYKTTNLFSFLFESNRLGDIKGLFQLHQSEYWRFHYRFGKVVDERIPGLGKGSMDILIINTVCPLLVAYAKEKGMQAPIDKAERYLEMLQPENNKITRMWESLGVDMANAFYSQAGIELFNSFCNRNKCLNCTIGVSILSPNTAKHVAR